MQYTHLVFLTALTTLVEGDYYIEACSGEIFEDFEYEHNRKTEERLTFLLKSIENEQNFDTVIIVKMKGKSLMSYCPFENLTLQTLQYPAVIMNQDSAERFIYYKENFSTEVILAICANNFDDVLQVFQTKLFVILNDKRHIAYMAEANETDLEQFCSRAFEMDFFNVLLIFADFYRTNTYYKCRKFPPSNQSFRASLILDSNETTTIFENQFLDMYGTRIATLPDQFLPRTMVYYDESGKLNMLGYVAKMVHTFAERRNATLYFPLPIEPGEILLYKDFRVLLDNGLLDIATSTISNPLEMAIRGLSYPFEISSYCLMIPMPRHIPLHEVYFIVIQFHVLIIIVALIIIYGILLLIAPNKHYRKLSIQDIIINDKGIRGMLGQPFSMPANLNFKTKFICLQLGYASLLINTMYQAYLHSYFTEPPREKLVTHPDDIERAGLRVLIPPANVDFLNELPNSMVFTHPHLVDISKDIDEFDEIRQSLRTSYCYPVNQARWYAYSQQQAHFKHRMFFHDENFCFSSYVLFQLPIRETLPYRAMLDDYIRRIHATGLFQLWMSQSFYDLVKLNMSSFDDLSTADFYGEIFTISNLKLILLIYLACIAIAILTFIGEQIAWRVDKKAAQRNICI